MDVLPEQAPGEDGDGHEGRPQDGRAALDEDRVEDEEHREDQAGGSAREADEAEEREQEQGDNGDVAAADGEEVIEPRLLQIVDRRFVESAVLAEKQGLEDGAGRRDVQPVGRRKAPLELALDREPDAGHAGPRRCGRRRREPPDEERGLGRAAAVDAQALKVAFVGKGPEVPEGAPAAEAGGSPDLVAGRIGETRTGAPGDRHAQPEPAAAGEFPPPGADCPDIQDEDVPVQLAAGRTGQAADDIYVSIGLKPVKRVRLIGAVELGQAGGAETGAGEDRQERRRPVAPTDKKVPGRPEGGRSEAEGRDRRHGEAGRGDDARGQGGGQENERVGAGP
jgi:hypothetical protein